MNKVRHAPYSNPKLLEMKNSLFFHYTSIETLALILESRQIKFSRLDRVNDLTEAETKDFGNMGHLYYVSCWTNQKNESIPFWNMYTNRMKGIRLELPFPILMEYQDNNIIENSTYTNKNGESFLLSYDGFNRVLYSKSDDNYLQNLYVNQDDLSKLYEFNPNIGLIKKGVWKFESEWRYKIKVFNLKREFDKESGHHVSRPYTSSLSSGKLPNELYFKINSSAFNKMKIRLGPRTTLAEKLIVEALISKFNTNAIIEISELDKVVR